MSAHNQKKSTLLSADLLTVDQQDCIDAAYNADELLIYAKMGAGKTIISLTCVHELIADGVLDRVIVFAPLKVARSVWTDEQANWSHLTNLPVTFCGGSADKREATVRGMSGKGVMVVAINNMAWFFDTFKGKHGFDGLIIDELSKVKAGGKNFKRLRKHLDTFKWKLGLTGTPVHDHIADIFYQIMTLDMGARLGKNKTKFLETFFDASYDGFSWEVKPDGLERIVKLIADLVYTVPDYTHTLPPLTIKPINVFLPPDTLQFYNELANTGVVDTEYGMQVCDNGAVLSGRLEQVASGALYCNDEFNQRVGTLQIHDEKIAACKSLVEAIDGNVILNYWYQHELDRLKEAFPDAVELNDEGAQAAWNDGRVKILLVQPMSASHGIQLQFGGVNIIWFKPVWSNDIFRQSNSRVWRTGCTRPVTVYELVCVGTVDEMIIDRIEGKQRFDKMFSALLESL